MGTIWELDFYSRPIVDENNKKIWEILICDSPQAIARQPEAGFRFAEYCANTEVNSLRLKQAIETAIAQAPSPPDKIRFFRQAMTNMITKACDDLGLPSVLSRRTYHLNHWLQQRLEHVYPQHPGFQPGTNPSVNFAATAPQPLPEALLGQQWAFVSLGASAFDDMAEWEIDFGEAFPLEFAALPPTAPIPGLIIFSHRATPLAAWMSGLELANVAFDSEGTPRLLLETGVSDRWILAKLTNSQLWAEAQQFEQAKHQANGVHFLAVQTNPESDRFAGFWLLQAPNIA